MFVIDDRYWHLMYVLFASIQVSCLQQPSCFRFSQCTSDLMQVAHHYHLKGVLKSRKYCTIIITCLTLLTWQPFRVGTHLVYLCDPKA